jgi:peptidoglycan/xylan/chitin deacetylase (PgdA/CDA1 family)
MNTQLKRAVERALRFGGPALLARLLHRDGALILAYHNVIPDDAPVRGDSSLHLSRSQFSAQLDILQRTCDVVPLRDLLASPPRDSRRPRVAITFDDAYRGAVTIGVAELARRGLPATIFVAPGFVGEIEGLWWDCLTAPDAKAPAVDRELALEELRGDGAAIRQWAARHAVPGWKMPVHSTVATEEELGVASKHEGISLGSHSWSHPNLCRVTPSELEEEMRRPLEWLRQRFDAIVPWIAYPYGLSCAAVERAAAASGYRAGVRVAGGWIPRSGVDPLALPRLNVPAGLSLDGFVLRTGAVGWP